MKSFRITLVGGQSIKTKIAHEKIASTLLPLIEEGCKIGADFLITDLDSEADIVFLNAPSLEIRRYAWDFENFVGERPADLPEIGIERSNSEFHKITNLFNLVEASRPLPSVLDDWDRYGNWLRHIL